MGASFTVKDFVLINKLIPLKKLWIFLILNEIFFALKVAEGGDRNKRKNAPSAKAGHEADLEVSAESETAETNSTDAVGATTVIPRTKAPAKAEAEVNRQFWII